MVTLAIAGRQALQDIIPDPGLAGEAGRTAIADL
jgi:hypothetical protein